ncbi:biotin/lipoate A/B protein ligase family protein [Thermotoga sp. KOL6]|uniref:lipoate--protein ligase family protein n=1 Tax=Thermotoga sp. KOL6 TaxID=126741 RepID=UPI001E658CA5|nr:biotin/lipoate A/B protein ligase family protein [Thermotoga sp. KOL6]
MAIDSLMAKWAQQNQAVFFRFYGWERPTVSLGRFQKEDGLRVPESLDFVRRPSGGRAVLHHSEITYCIAVPKTTVFGRLSVLEFHKIVHGVIKDVLRELGVPAELSNGKRGNTAFCFDASSKYEVVIDGIKIVGSAQFRTQEAIVEHGSIVLRQDNSLLREIFSENVPYIQGLLDLYEIDVEDIKRRMIKRFENLFGISFRIDLRDDMLEEAKKVSHLFDLRRR